MFHAISFFGENTLYAINFVTGLRFVTDYVMFYNTDFCLTSIFTIAIRLAMYNFVQITLMFIIQYFGIFIQILEVFSPGVLETNQMAMVNCRS